MIVYCLIYLFNFMTLEHNKIMNFRKYFQFFSSEYTFKRLIRYSYLSDNWRKRS